MARGDRAEFGPLYHPRAVDRENRIQPPSSRVPGPACFYSTALWLRAAFADPHYRDDLGMARQLGWIPPSPAYLIRMARAKRRAARP
jgi:hypothetical protein